MCCLHSSGRITGGILVGGGIYGLAEGVGTIHGDGASMVLYLQRGGAWDEGLDGLDALLFMLLARDAALASGW